MKKLTYISISILILMTVIFALGYYLTTPAKRIVKYEKYYTNDTLPLEKGSVKITYLGVSTLLFDDGETQLLFDCFFSRPWILEVATSKISTDTTIVNNVLSACKINRLKAIFISHSHYDHSFDAAYVARKTNATLFGSESSINIGKGGGLNDAQTSLFEPKKEQRFGEFTVTVIPSKHSPTGSFNDDLGEIIDEPLTQPTKVRDFVEGGTFDFLIKHKNRSMYIKPSTNYIQDELKDVSADILFLGIALLGKQDSTFQNNYYKETVTSLQPKIVIPIHWDNFFYPLSEELELMPRIMDNTPKGLDFLIEKTKKDNVDLKILQGYKSIIVSEEKIKD